MSVLGKRGNHHAVEHVLDLLEWISYDRLLCCRSEARHLDQAGGHLRGTLEATLRDSRSC
eukprot:1474956-Pyramimonas_sp.AAC.1